MKDDTWRERAIRCTDALKDVKNLKDLELKLRRTPERLWTRADRDAAGYVADADVPEGHAGGGIGIVAGGRMVVLGAHVNDRNARLDALRRLRSRRGTAERLAVQTCAPHRRDERAATTMQAMFRARQGRKRFYELMHEHYKPGGPGYHASKAHFESLH